MTLKVNEANSKMEHPSDMSALRFTLFCWTDTIVYFIFVLVLVQISKLQLRVHVGKCYEDLLTMHEMVVFDTVCSSRVCLSS